MITVLLHRRAAILRSPRTTSTCLISGTITSGLELHTHPYMVVDVWHIVAEIHVVKRLSSGSIPVYSIIVIVNVSVILHRKQSSECIQKKLQPLILHTHFIYVKFATSSSTHLLGASCPYKYKAKYCIDKQSSTPMFLFDQTLEYIALCMYVCMSVYSKSAR